ncbi:MAG: hypothetical protein KBH07_14200 [Flavobacteriales bacterium]|nr:hypothetical protein [Flavobacteriales bacterium]MBP9079284.1 hypothetical protein [Flavobacteriales bacterium]
MNRRGIRWDRRLEAALVIALGISFGSWREFAFINLNYQIDHLARHTPFSFAHSLVQGWTRGLELHTLLLIKWVVAFFSMAVMAGLCILLARVLFGQWRQAKSILLGFAAFALLSLAMHFAARWAPPFELVSVQLAHMLQYPVPLVFVLLAATLPRTMGGAG